MEVGNLITEDYAGKQSINFVISELVNNIYDHTSFEKNMQVMVISMLNYILSGKN